MLFDPLNGDIYVSGTQIFVINPASNTVVATIEGGGGPLTLDTKNGELFSTGNGEVFIVDTTTNSLKTILSSTVTSRNLVYDPFTDQVYGVGVTPTDYPEMIIIQASTNELCESDLPSTERL